MLEDVVMGFLKTFRDRTRSTREIDSLGDNVLADLGISRAGLQKLSSTSQVVMRRFAAMSTRQGVEPADIKGDLQDFSVLVERCKNCGETRACAKFLADSSVGADQAAFCPNLPEFRRISHK